MSQLLAVQNGPGVFERITGSISNAASWSGRQISAGANAVGDLLAKIASAIAPFFKAVFSASGKFFKEVQSVCTNYPKSAFALLAAGVVTTLVGQLLFSKTPVAVSVEPKTEKTPASTTEAQVEKAKDKV